MENMPRRCDLLFLDFDPRFLVISSTQNLKLLIIYILGFPAFYQSNLHHFLELLFPLFRKVGRTAFTVHQSSMLLLSASIETYCLLWKFCRYIYIYIYKFSGSYLIHVLKLVDEMVLIKIWRNSCCSFTECLICNWSYLPD